MSADGSVLVRPAEPRDVPVLYGFIRALAAYERAPDRVLGTEAMLEHSLFGAVPVHAEALLAVDGGVGGEGARGGEGEPLGFALFHGTFSTWECRPGLWLEDLFVPESARRRGVGGALLAAVAARAIERGCARLDWTALDWNAPALAFYAGLGAERMEEWTTHRLEGAPLAALAARAE